MNRPAIFPVIHYLNRELAISNANMALRLGCTGVFVISMDGNDEPLEVVAKEVKKLWPDKTIGVNYLTLPAIEGLRRNLAAGLDATWTDSSGVGSGGVTDEAMAVAALLREKPTHQFFGSVAFKYQKRDSDPAAAAVVAAELGMIPTTSGSATGKAADLGKIQSMRDALGSRPLGIASGITPENIHLYAPMLTHILVATGISADFHSFSEERLTALMAAIA